MSVFDPKDTKPASGSASPTDPPDTMRRRVLVVDDEPGMRYMARRVLERRFDVSEAESSEDALSILDHEDPFHFAVVDVRLPGISGLELLTQIKSRNEKMDVIVMTGSVSNPDEALEDAVRRKAFFFLRKPFPMSILETLADRVVESQVLEEQLSRHVRALERDLESARIFQRRLLPAQHWEGERIQVASLYMPSERLSGDFIDCWSLPGGGSALLAADIMGHGAPSAMVTGIVKSQMRTQSDGDDPAAALTALDTEMAALPGLPFLTALLIYDLPHHGAIRYAGAGHPPGFLLGSRGTGGVDSGSAGSDGSMTDSGLELFPLASTGLPINTGLPPIARVTKEIQRPRGGRILLYTDGFPEAKDQSGAAFDDGPEGRSPFLTAVGRALCCDSAAAAVSTLDDAWRAHVRGTNPDDDRAAVAAWLS